MECYSATEKNDKSYNMEKAHKHYTKWKPDTQKVARGFHLHEMLKIGKSTVTESKTAIAKDWERGNEKIGHFFLGWWNVPELDHGHSCTTKWLNNTHVYI